MKKSKAKKSKSNPSVFSGYEWVKARVDLLSGEVNYTYRVAGMTVDGSTGHDEDASSWTDQEIRGLACDLLEIKPSDAHRIEVVRD